MGGKRISESGDGGSSSFTNVITESDYLYVHEDETFNLRNSGREWFGEVLTIEKKSFDITIPDLITTAKSIIKSEVAIRTAIPTYVNIYLNNDKNPFITHFGNSVNFDTDDNFADISDSQRSFDATSNFNLTYDFYRPQLGSEAWLNYFEIQCKRKLKPIDGQIHFFNLESKIVGNVKFQIEDFSSDYLIWDISNPIDVSIQKHLMMQEKGRLL